MDLFVMEYRSDGLSRLMRILKISNIRLICPISVL